MSDLSPDDAVRLSKSLSQAVDLHDLEQFVWQATGDRLFVEYVGPGLPLRKTLDRLIEALEQDGTTERLVQVVWRERPFKADLRQVLAELYPNVAQTGAVPSPVFELQSGGTPQQDAPPPTAPGLQRLIRPKLKQLDIRAWYDRMGKLMRQVCRIEFDQTGVGTGFLVGDGRVLTNWHVVDQIRSLGGADRMAVRFDYHKGADGDEPGEVMAVREVLDERPCAPSEIAGQADAEPGPDDLDYALLSLDKPTGDRGWITLRQPPPVAKDDPIVIVQHPQAATMKFALDDSAVEGFVHQNRRLRYRTNTEGGSSGSPCFNWDLDLVALHHLGDPTLTDPQYNQGIPIGLVLDSLNARVPGAIAEA
ncbi:serine protease [Paracoccus sp. TK19116]|uniref:Serine protease n=1 Tax=Paracoccus albicereus TaxID=2922394 RepID=A0ABT1MPK0_9RHOB|nr:trypsin-like peptidase domain-containing protein [Paracoccus albicereus]MCQ0970220.1 serine protease [Paracoccus albicereus]